MYYVSKQHFSNIFAFSSVTLLNPKVRDLLSNVERVSTVEDDLDCSEEGRACSPSAAISSADGIGIQHLSSPRTCWTRSQNFKIRFKQTSSDCASKGGWSLNSHWVSRCWDLTGSGFVDSYWKSRCLRLKDLVSLLSFGYPVSRCWWMTGPGFGTWK